MATRQIRLRMSVDLGDWTDIWDKSRMQRRYWWWKSLGVGRPVIGKKKKAVNKGVY